MSIILIKNDALLFSFTISALEHPKTFLFAGRLGRALLSLRKRGAHLLPLGTAISTACRRGEVSARWHRAVSAVLYTRDYLLIFKCLLDLSSCV